MTTVSPGISGIRYAFPAESRSVRELAVAGLLQSDVRVLEGFGFDRVHVARGESPYDLALAAARDLIETCAVAPESIGLLVCGGAPASIAFAPGNDGVRAGSAVHSTERFRYPATRLQFELGLTNASVLGVEQLACTTLFGAVRIARSLCITEGIERALCVVSEFFPADAGREAIFNCTSDAACAVLVERTGERNRVIASAHVTKGYYWDADTMRNEIVASYFPTAKQVIEHAISEAGWDARAVDWVIPHNVGVRSWEILLGLVRLPNARLWSRNIARDGHTLAGDNFINLSDALASGAISRGDKMLLFSYGYGAHWTAFAVEA